MVMMLIFVLILFVVCNVDCDGLFLGNFVLCVIEFGKD